jgi:hypothetical protein
MLPAAKQEATRRQLERAVARSGWRHRWRRPGYVAVASGAILLGSTAAVTFAHFQAVTNKTEARCYTVPSTAGDDHFTTISASGQPGSKAQVDHALSVCGDLWRQGFLRTGASGIDRTPDSSVTHPVPALVVCTMPDGTAAVLPGTGQTCSKLGLAAASNP